MEKIYGLIGKSLSHSFSQVFFSNKLAALQIKDSSYRNFELKCLEKEVPELKANDVIKGLNVTIPYKQAILKFLDEVTETVSAVNACNCIEVRNGRWIGHNTDIIGFENSFKPLLKPAHQKALVLGTGGASAAVQFVLKKLNIPYLQVSRTPDDKRLSYSGVNAELLRNYHILINTTPLGMSPFIDDFPHLPYDALTESHYLYDLIYNPSVTLFLKKGKEVGATIKNGQEMLEMQAEESWRIWNA